MYEELPRSEVLENTQSAANVGLGTDTLTVIFKCLLNPVEVFSVCFLSGLSLSTEYLVRLLLFSVI